MKCFGGLLVVVSILAIPSGGCWRNWDRDRPCCCAPAPAAQCAPAYYAPAAAPCGCAPAPVQPGTLAPVAR
jgi:hypothetical protein